MAFQSLAGGGRGDDAISSGHEQPTLLYQVRILERPEIHKFDTSSFDIQSRLLAAYSIETMARTKQRARRTTLSNAERIRRRDKQAQITCESYREFKYFAQLPPDLKLEIFKYFPFYSWATVLSPVCKEWRYD
jgi:hypothetical protein